MSRTIKAIERHMILPDRATTRGGPQGSQSKVLPIQSQSYLGRIGFHSRPTKLVAEWQQRGPETLSGLAVRKLRLSFAPRQSVLIASAAG